MPLRVLRSDLCGFHYVNPQQLISNEKNIHPSPITLVSIDVYNTLEALRSFVPSHGSLSFEDNPIIPVRDTRALIQYKDVILPV